MSTVLAQLSTSPLPENVHLVATDAQQMGQATDQLIGWLTFKINDVKAELAGVEAAAIYAKEHKWAHATLDNQVKNIGRRVSFYEKVREAVQAGYTIIPNFPIDVFAIRVNRNKPTGQAQWNWDRKAFPVDEKCSVAPIGEGDYHSLVPKVDHDLAPENKDGKIRDKWWATPVAFQDPEFPVIAAQPVIMDATNKAMARKLFDQIGICPQSGRQRRKGDPLIIGQIIDNSRSVGYGDPKRVSFLIAWHLDLRTL